MNPQSTSFIPQRPTQGTVKKRSVRKIYVLTYISYVLFFGSVFAAVGTFAYNTILHSQLQVQKDRLVKEESKFNQTDIDSVRDLDKKIKTASARMDLHLSVLPVFDALEQSVAKSLQLDSFKYTRADDAAPKIVVKGTTAAFDSLVFQRGVLATNPVLAGGVFTQVSLASVAPVDAKTGIVHTDKVETKIAFSLSKEVDTSLLRYAPTAVSAGSNGTTQSGTNVATTTSTATGTTSITGTNAGTH